MIVAFSFINLTAHSQEINPSSSEEIPVKIKDTIIDSLKDSLNLKLSDSLLVKPKDTIKKPIEVLEGIIEHSADSLIRQDIINNKIILFNNAQVKYKDIDLTAGYIEIDIPLLLKELQIALEIILNFLYLNKAIRNPFRIPLFLTSRVRKLKYGI